MIMVTVSISQSEIATWTRCPRKWFLTYYLGYVPATESPVNVRLLGVRCHTALEGWYGYQLDPVSVLHILYQVEISEHPEYEEELRKERDLAHAMITGYLEWVPETGADADLEVVATEADVQVPCPGLEGVMLRAQMDQVFRELSTGRLGFMDYKTTANFDKHELLMLDPQMPFYCLVQHLASGQWVPGASAEKVAARPLVTGGLITSLRRVKRTDRSKPPYYQRDPIWYTPEKMDSTLIRVQQVCSEILSARAELDAAYAAGGDLSRINWLQRSKLRPVPQADNCSWSCPHIGVCPMMDDGSDWTGVLVSSGKYRQADPYEYYRDDALRAVRAALEKL
jgi:hypothetical protein